MTWYHPKYYAALRAERKKLQAASAKPQAPSGKRQGPDRPAQPEIVLNKKSIDRDPELGYRRINKTKPPLKVRAMSAVSKAGTFRAVRPRIHAVTIKDSTVGLCTCPAASSKSQATEIRAPSPKLQASSVKHQADIDNHE